MSFSTKAFHSIKNIAIIAGDNQAKITFITKLIQNTLKKYSNDTFTHDAVSESFSKYASLILPDETGNFHKVNIIDMPNSESSEDIEGVLAMTDGVILMLDSAEGIISQTKFALSKALAQGFQPLVIFDKIEREDQRSDEILSEIENFLLNSQASESQLAFQYLYASSRNAWAIEEFTQIHDANKDFTPLFHKLIHYFAPSDRNKDTTFSMLVSALQHDKYAGRMLVGRIQSGMVKINEPISAYHLTGEHCENGQVVQLFQYNGNERVSIESAVAGDIVMIVGMEHTTVTDTLCTLGEKIVIPAKPLNPYTISINVGVNTSPLAGTEGKKLTSRMIKERLYDEANANIAIKVYETDSSETFEVYGYSEPHLGILVENMRREGFELTVSKVQIIVKCSKDNPTKLSEPYYEVVVDTPTDYSGQVIEALNHRKGVMIEMFEFGADTTRIIYHVALRFLIGFRQEFTNITRGFGMFNQTFLKYDELIKDEVEKNRKGALISSETGEAVAYALSKLQDRGIMYIQPQQKVYRGMIVGENTRNEDMEINVIKGKALTNMRASGSDEAYNLTPPKIMSLSEMMPYLNYDECIEVTPISLRMRKIFLDSTERKSKMGNISRNSYQIVED